MVLRVTVVVTFVFVTFCGLTFAASISTARHNDDHIYTKEENTFDMLDFLEQYGYLLGTRNRNGERVYHSEVTVTQAVRDFQAFTGLPVTGELTEETMRKMRSPRCGFPDLPLVPLDTSHTSGDGHPSPQNFYLLGRRWNKDTVTWRPLNFSEDLPVHQQWRALDRALKYWSDVTPIKFRPTSDTADIEIQFARGSHGDGSRNSFDGKGGVLAHAFQPGQGIGGDTHFDEAEDWSLGTGEGADLEVVAAHEFGHALGLGHSDVPGALMAPYYAFTRELKLHRDDVRGIQALYGPKRPTESTATTTISSSSTTTTATTTTPKPSTTTQDPIMPSYCRSDFRVDAIAGGEGGVSYLFRGHLVYKVGRRGLQEDYPRRITDVFPGAPRRHLSAAVYLSHARAHYLFKHNMVWRYTDFRLDIGYPRIWLSNRDYFRFRPSAALTFTYGSSINKIFMFGNGEFWEWDPNTETVVPGYPLPTERYWLGAPRHPEAATTNNHNNFFFFKGSKFFKLHNRVSQGDARPVGTHWFGPACDGFSTPFHPDRSPERPHPPSSSHHDVMAEGSDSWGDDVPSGTSHLSQDHFYRQVAASLPFEFDVRVQADEREPEHRGKGRY